VKKLVVVLGNRWLWKLSEKYDVGVWYEYIKKSG